MSLEPNDDGQLVVSEAEAKANATRHEWAHDRGWSSRKAPKEAVAAFRQACRDEFERIHAIKIAAKIACGDILEHVGDDKDGRPVYGETKNSDRLRAIEWLAGNGWGLPRQAVELDISTDSPQSVETGEAVAQRVLAAFTRTLMTAPPKDKERILGLLAPGNPVPDAKKPPPVPIVESVSRPLTQRIIIAGGPKTGKTTLAETFGLPVRHGDDLIGSEWSAMSVEMATWLNEPAPWVIEGVQAGRTLRKWLPEAPNDLSGLTVYYLRHPKRERTPEQDNMAAGCETVWEEIEHDLRLRGATVIVA